MGFFKKIFSGIKKVVKKVGKGIKGLFKKVGKFMDKIGIIGQIGLALVLPGIGQMLSAGLTGLGGAMAGYTGLGSTVVNAAGKFIQGAVTMASRTSKFFGTVTDGVGKVLGETVGAAAKSLGITSESFIGKGLGKIGIDVNSASWEGVWKETQTAFTETVSSATNIVTGAQDKALAALREETLANTFSVDPTEQVQAGLQEKIDQAVDVGLSGEEVVSSAQQVVEESLLAPSSTAAYDQAAEALRQETMATTFATEEVEESLLDKVVGKGKEIYERGISRAEESITNFPTRAAEAVQTKALQAIGVVDTPEYNVTQYSIGVPSIDMGSTTDIGYGLTTPSLQNYYDAFGAETIASNPYGFSAQLYNVYGEAMKARGFG